MASQPLASVKNLVQGEIIFMSTLFHKIGEHHLQIICQTTYELQHIRTNFGFQLNNINIKPDMVLHIEHGYGVPFTNYEVNINKKSQKVSFQRADYLIEIDQEYTLGKIAYHDELALKHALMNLYSSFIVYKKWGLLIHSSCIKDKIKAHIFAGQSGAGKSTIAKLSQPRALLSDEATILKITTHEISVFNSPFNSELETSCNEQSTNLGSIHLLKQDKQNKRIKLAKTDGLLHLIDKVFYWEQTPEETKNIFELLKMLINNVPIYDLHFQKNDTFWELIS